MTNEIAPVQLAHSWLAVVRAGGGGVLLDDVDLLGVDNVKYDYFEEQAVLGNIEYAERQIETFQAEVDHWKERRSALIKRAAELRAAHDDEEVQQDRWMQ